MQSTHALCSSTTSLPGCYGPEATAARGSSEQQVMARCVLLLAAVVLAAATLGRAARLEPHNQIRAAAARKAPSFPDEFEASYTFSLPYVLAVQTKGLSFPVRLWHDGPSARLRVDVYGGLDSTVTIKDTTYLVYPRINATVCDTIHDDVGPTASGAGAAGRAAAAAASLSGSLLAAAPLPDLSSWAYAGATSIGNEDVDIWQLSSRKGGKVNTYTFYLTPQGTPIRLYMMGFNILAGSHFDEYLLDFTSFKAGPVNDDVFEVPAMCKAKHAHQAQAQMAQGVGSGGRRGGALLSSSLALMPWARLGAAGAAADGLQQQRNPQLGAQALQRLAASDANREYVAAWNAANTGPGGAGFKLALNRFADWLPSEYVMMTAKRSSGRSEQVKRETGLGEVAAPPGVTKAHLPKSVDWRGTGAAPLVKDQATCGSCWAFSAAGAMQGAWYAATGRVLSLSEQQLVDCSWAYGNNGCQGGEMEPAIQYIADAGGAAAEEDYQYRGQNMFCNVNATNPSFKPVAAFKGWAHVKKRDEVSLMWAVWKHGPVAISLDASQPSFKFYSEGVYSDSHCLTKRGQLDHAVLLVGYGTDKITGEDYWLVANSWSQYWGETGYIRMLRTPGDGNDCGITSDPVLAVVHPDHPHVAQGLRGSPLVTW